MPTHKTYIGDGVYVQTDGHHAWLTTEDGISVTNRIALEAPVYHQLVKWIERYMPEEWGRSD